VETLRIAVATSSLNKVPSSGYGSEIMVYNLALGLYNRGHEVHFYGPYMTVNDGLIRHPMVYTPATVSLDAEHDAIDSDIEKMDFVLDATATCAFQEELHYAYKHRPHACWRNGIDFTYPRFARHNVAVLSELAREYAMNGWGALHESDYVPVIDYQPKLRVPIVMPYGIRRVEPCDGTGDYILYFSRIHIHKGIVEFLKLAKRNPDLKFLVAGDASWGDHWFYYHIARDLAPDNVEFMVDVEDPREAFCRAKAFVYMPQYAEAFGLVIVQSVAYGIPVVSPESSRKFITRELHHLINFGNVDEMIRQDLRRPSYEDLKGFTEEDMVNRWLGFIKSAVNGYETGE